MAQAPPVPALSPEALLDRYRRTGDPAAFAALYDATAPDLFRLALALAPDPASAEDALQDAFLAALDAARRPEPVREAMPWLVGILKHKVMHVRHKATRAPDPLRLEPRILEGDPASDAARAEEIEQVRRALEDLPEPYREVAILRWRYGVEPAAIAHARGVPPGTVRSLLSRAVEKLRAALGALCVSFLDARPPRGPEAVRDAILRAARAAAPSRAAAAAAFVLGGALVAKKTAAAVLVLVLLLAGGWFVADRIVGGKDSRAPDAPGSRGSDARTAPAPAKPVVAVPVVPDAPAPQSVRAFPVPNPSGTLLVRVTWEEDGTPAAGVLVRVHSWDGPDPFLFMFEERTGADGTAAFAAVFPGRAGVYLDVGGARTPTVEAGGRTEIAIRIPRGIAVEGSVVDALGKPVPGAMVAGNGREIARTGPDGAFRLRAAENGLRLGARTPGHAPSGKVLVMGEPGTTSRVRLALRGAGSALAGRVLDPSGRPVSGARLQVVEEKWFRQMVLEDGTSTQPQDPFEVRTGPDGRFLVEGVEPGKNRVQARAAGLSPWTEVVAVAAGETKEIEIRLQAGAVAEGTVKDAAGAPVPGARVLCGRYGEFTTSMGTSDAEGRWRLENLVPGTSLLEADGDEKGKASASVAATPETPAHWDAVLGEGVVIAGRVLDEAGGPREGWAVIAFQDPGFLWVASARTDADGRFVLRNAGSLSLRIEVQAKTADGSSNPWPSAVREGVLKHGEDLVFTIPDAALPSASVAGLVVDPAGKPLGGASFRIQSTGDPKINGATTEEGTGKFRVGPLPPGRYELSIDAKGFPVVDLGTRSLARDEALDLGTIRLAAGGSLEVRARRADGRPIEYFWGKVFAEEGDREQWLRTEKDLGRCGSLPPGRYRVRAEATLSPTERYLGFAAAEIRTGEKTAVEAVLAPAGGCILRAVFGRGSSTPDQIRFVVREPGGAIAWEGTGGVTQNLAFLPGAYAVEASTADGLRAEARFEVAAPGPGISPTEAVLTLK